MNKLRIGIAGLGTVAQGVLHLIATNGDLMAKRTGVQLSIQRVASRTTKPEVDLLGGVFSNNVHDLVADPDVDVILELIGGEGLAKELIESALAAGKRVVAANKAVIAAHGDQLLASGNVPLRFEAAVAGAIPIIQSLNQGLAANRIESIYGIINGTCNYMLTVMEEEGLAFDQVLSQAQALGYAEADPAFDIEGVDAAHKLTILAALGFATSYDFSALYVEGITQIAAEDIQYAQELGFKIKHLGIARNTDAGLETRVHPALVPTSELLASVNGVMNAVQVVSDAAGETLFSGQEPVAQPQHQLSWRTYSHLLLLISVSASPHHRRVKELQHKFSAWQWMLFQVPVICGFPHWISPEFLPRSLVRYLLTALVLRQ